MKSQTNRMEAKERERLAFSVAAALLLHAALFVALEQVDWNALRRSPIEPPVAVQLREISVAQVPDEEQAEPAEPEPQPEPEPEPPPPQPEPEPEPEPEETRIEEAPPEERAELSSEPAAEAPPPEESSPQAEAAPPPESEAQPQDRESPPEPRRGVGEPSDEPGTAAGDRVSLEELYGRQPDETEPEETRSSPARERRSRSEPTPPPETPAEPDIELPEWTQRVEEAGISTEEMEHEDVRRLASEIEQDPEFARKLQQAIDALESARDRASAQAGGRDGDGGRRSAAPDPASGDAEPDQSGDQATSTPGSGPGNADIEWTGPGGDRGNPGPLPRIGPEDFGGRVPAESTFVVIFTVDDKGVVVPGSVIFQQKSRFTVVNEKIRRAIQQWQFSPKPQTPTEKAIFTLRIRREEVTG